jgi:hypothetical protein
MIRYYDKLVERTINDMADSDKMLDQLLEEQEEEEDESQQQEEMMQELLQHIQEVKNKKLH